MLIGLVMRLTGYVKDQALINDAILSRDALERGCVLLTRNLADVDVFHQLVPIGHASFYRQVKGGLLAGKCGKSRTALW